MEKPWDYEALVSHIPHQTTSWLAAGPNAVEGEISSRLSNLRL